MELGGKVAVVTGAARGIGRGIALALAAEGVRVALVDLAEAKDARLPYELSDVPTLRQTAGEVERLGVGALSIFADVTRAADAQRIVAETVERFGRLDILVNNAGVVTFATVAEMAEEQWDRTLEVNLKGVFLCCRAAIPELVKSGAGRVVNIASVAGKTGHGGLSAYCASKFGVIGFTQALAQELGPANVTVNAVCPGFLRTAMWTQVLDKVFAEAWKVEDREVFDRFVARNTYLGREQTPADIGQCVVYLCKADNVTGEAINVAGGGEVH
jgi:meso-butanediol dehydrogenase/(S,S)-butanediol dehydrogenase/diacetyl reductase